MKTYKSILFGIILALSFSVQMNAQDYGTSIKLPAVFNQYHVYPSFINPAYAGFEEHGVLFFNYRRTWADFDEAPHSFSGNYNGRITDRVGLGAMIFSDQFGVNDRLRAELNYAYHFDSENSKMAFGLSTGYVQYKLDNEALTDPGTEPGDQTLIDAVNGRQYFTAGLGFYGEFDEKFIFGLSLPNVVASRLDENGEGDDESEFSYLAMLGYRSGVSNYDMIVEPSIVIRKVGSVPLNFDLNLKASFLEERLFAGVSYGNGAGSRLGFLLGTRINNLHIYYGYDVSFEEIQGYNDGSHEIGLKIDLKRLGMEAEKTMDGGN